MTEMETIEMGKTNGFLSRRIVLKLGISEKTSRT
jgi:hypothetical protein